MDSDTEEMSLFTELKTIMFDIILLDTAYVILHYTHVQMQMLKRYNVHVVCK